MVTNLEVNYVREDEKNFGFRSILIWTTIGVEGNSFRPGAWLVRLPSVDSGSFLQPKVLAKVNVWILRIERTIRRPSAPGVSDGTRLIATQPAVVEGAVLSPCPLFANRLPSLASPPIP